MITKENKIVISMEKKFGELTFDSSEFNFGGFLFNLDEINNKEKYRIIKKIINNHIDKMFNNYIIYQKKIHKKISFHIH